MTKAAHTPGPWVVQAEFDDEPAYIAPESDLETMFVSVAPGHLADARLIAAAPELLEALKHALATAETIKSEDWFWVRAARAAIARATGEQT